MYIFFVSYYLENGTINNSIISSDESELSYMDIQTIKNKLKEKNGQEVRIIFFTRLKKLK